MILRRLSLGRRVAVGGIIVITIFIVLWHFWVSQQSEIQRGLLILTASESGQESIMKIYTVLDPWIKKEGKDLIIREEAGDIIVNQSLSEAFYFSFTGNFDRILLEPIGGCSTLYAAGSTLDGQVSLVTRVKISAKLFSGENKSINLGSREYGDLLLAYFKGKGGRAEGRPLETDRGTGLWDRCRGEFCLTPRDILDVVGRNGVAKIVLEATMEVTGDYDVTYQGVRYKDQINGFSSGTIGTIEFIIKDGEISSTIIYLTPVSCLILPTK